MDAGAWYAGAVAQASRVVGNGQVVGNVEFIANTIRAETWLRSNGRKLIKSSRPRLKRRSMTAHGQLSRWTRTI